MLSHVTDTCAWWMSHTVFIICERPVCVECDAGTYHFLFGCVHAEGYPCWRTDARGYYLTRMSTFFFLSQSGLLAFCERNLSPGIKGAAMHELFIFTFQRLIYKLHLRFSPVKVKVQRYFSLKRYVQGMCVCRLITLHYVLKVRRAEVKNIEDWVIFAAAALHLYRLVFTAKSHQSHSPITAALPHHLHSIQPCV